MDLIHQIPIQKPYKIIQQIGEGSESQIFTAYNKEGKVVVIKQIRNQKIKSVLKEIQITALLNFPKVHTGFLNHIDIYQTLDYVHLVFDYLGNTLDLSQSSLNLNKKELCLEITNLVEYMHSKKVVHLDLKPENILISQGKPKIIDFGLSCYLGRSKKISYITKQKDIVGTPIWMAPEFFHSSINLIWYQDYEYDAFDNLYLADLYSLGLIFYWIYHDKKLPFTAKTKTEMLCKKLERTEDLLNFKIRTGDDGIDKLIWDLLDPIPLNRPSLSLIKNTFLQT